jgi:hypothetical protein
MKERHEGSTRREAGNGRPSSALCCARRRLASASHWRATTGRELLRELVAAAFAEALVLFPVNRVGLGEDLSRDLLVIARRALGRVRMNLRPVDRITPTRTRLTSAQSASPAPHRPANAVSRRCRKRAIVA